MKTLIIIVLATLSISLIASVTNNVTLYASNHDTTSGSADLVCKGIGRASGSNQKCNDRKGSINKTINKVISVLAFIIGVISVIMVMIGGFRYVTSGGDANATKGARDTILYALIGLVIAVMAQVIVSFVLSKFT